MPLKIFYTYLWLREDGTPYYVGKGSGIRGRVSSSHGVHRPKDSTRILIQEFPSEQDAFTAEKFLISFYGRIDVGTGSLRNLTEGGEGAAGCTRSIETRRKMSLAKKGKPVSESALRNMKAAHIGIVHTEETKRKISESQKGRKVSDEHRRKNSEAITAWWKKRRSVYAEET